MQYNWMTVLGIIFIFAMNTLGALSVFAFRKGISQKLQTLFFGFAGGVMLSASIWSLLLPALEQVRSLNVFLVIAVAFACFVGGLFIFLLDWITKHAQRKKDETGLQSSMKLFLAMTLHNIPEGFAIGFAFGGAHLTGLQASYFSALGLALGIGIQNLPEGAAVALPMRKEGKSAKISFLYGLVSGAVEPICAIIGYGLSSSLSVLQPWLLAISAGAMIYVTVEELLPDIGRGEYVTAGAWSFMFGFILMMTLDVLLG